MLPTVTNYRVVPSVVPMGKETEIKIVPNERAFLFFDGAEYNLNIICADDDEVCYFTPTTKHSVKLIAEDGILKFSYTFDREQEYLFQLEPMLLHKWNEYVQLPEYLGMHDKELNV